MRDIVDIPVEYRPAIEDLPGKDLRRLATAIEEHRPGEGVAIVLLIAQLFPGIPLYLSSVQKFIDQIRDDAIRAEYDAGGVAAKDLAIKWRPLSLRQVEKILARPSNQAKLKEKQMTLWSGRKDATG